MRRTLLSFAFVLAAAPVVLAQAVEVDGSDVTFPARETFQVAGQEVAMTATGAALREKAWFNVYAICSYIDAGAKVADARALVAADVPKALVLVMERDVDGDDMAEAFEDAVRLNHPEPEFAAELQRFRAFFDPKEAIEGKKITFLHLPKVGVLCSIEGQGELKIESVAFAQAIWDIYLGPKNIGDDIKQGMTSRLR